MHADSSSCGADLEYVGVVFVAGFLIVQNLVCIVSRFYFGRAEEKRSIVSGGKSKRILHCRPVIDIDDSRGPVCAIVTYDVFTIIEFQEVIVSFVLDSEFIASQGTVRVGDDTALGRDAQVRAIRSALEHPGIACIDDQVGAVNGERGGLGVFDGCCNYLDLRNPDHFIPGDGQLG